MHNTQIQPAIAARHATSDQSTNQTMCGIASSSRKKTVSRERCEIVVTREADRMLVLRFVMPHLRTTARQIGVEHGRHGV